MSKQKRRMNMSELLIALSGGLIVLTPLWPEPLLWLFAVLFWTLLIGGYVLLLSVSVWRRRDMKQYGESFSHPPGLFSRSPDFLTGLLTATAVISLIAFNLLELLQRDFGLLPFAVAALFLICVQLRCIRAGKNRAYLNRERHNSNKSKAIKKE